MDLKTIANEVETQLNTMNQSDAVQIGEAVAKTIISPSVPVLVEDLVLVHKIAQDVKTQLNGKPETLKNIFFMLLHGV